MTTKKAVAPVKQNETTLALDQKHSTKLHELGQEIIAAAGVMGDKYLKLVKYIRDNKLAPKLVTHELLALGFKKDTVSKINRVAMASNELFNQFEAKLLGFNKVLDLARLEATGEVKTTPAGTLLLGEGNVTEEEIEDSVETGTEGRAKGKGESKGSKIKSCAKYIAMNATRATTYNFKGAHYRVVVEKVAVEEIKGNPSNKA